MEFFVLTEDEGKKGRWKFFVTPILPFFYQVLGDAVPSRRAKAGVIHTSPFHQINEPCGAFNPHESNSSVDALFPASSTGKNVPCTLTPVGASHLDLTPARDVTLNTDLFSDPNLTSLLASRSLVFLCIRIK